MGRELAWDDVTYSRLPKRGVRPREVAAARRAQSPGDRRAPVGVVRGAEIAGLAGAHGGCRLARCFVAVETRSKHRYRYRDCYCLGLMVT